MCLLLETKVIKKKMGEEENKLSKCLPKLVMVTVRILIILVEHSD